MLATDWRLALASFGVIPFVYSRRTCFGRRCADSYRDIRTRLARINAYLQERITGMRVVQLFGREADEATAVRRAESRAPGGEPRLDHLLRAVFSGDRGADVDRAGEPHRRRSASRGGRLAHRRNRRGVPAARSPIFSTAAGPVGQVQHAPAGDGGERARFPPARHEPAADVGRRPRWNRPGAPPGARAGGRRARSSSRTCGSHTISAMSPAKAARLRHRSGC